MTTRNPCGADNDHKPGNGGGWRGALEGSADGSVGTGPGLGSSPAALEGAASQSFFWLPLRNQGIVAALALRISLPLPSCASCPFAFTCPSAKFAVCASCPFALHVPFCQFWPFASCPFALLALSRASWSYSNLNACPYRRLLPHAQG